MAERYVHLVEHDTDSTAFTELKFGKFGLWAYNRFTLQDFRPALTVVGEMLIAPISVGVGISTGAWWPAAAPAVYGAAMAADWANEAWQHRIARNSREKPDFRITNNSFYAGFYPEYAQFEDIWGVPNNINPMADPMGAVRFMLEHFQYGREIFLNIGWTSLDILAIRQQTLNQTIATGQSEEFTSTIEPETLEEQTTAVIDRLHYLCGDFVTALTLETQYQANKFATEITSPPEARDMVNELQLRTGLWSNTDPPTYPEIRPTWQTLNAIYEHRTFSPAPPPPWEVS